MMDEIRKAVQSLGCKGKVTVWCFDTWIYWVYLNGEKLGVYDINKHTFVD